MRIENDILIKLNRKYSEKEEMAYILRRFKELKSENHNLRDELHKKNQRATSNI